MYRFIIAGALQVAFLRLFSRRRPGKGSFFLSRGSSVSYDVISMTKLDVEKPSFGLRGKHQFRVMSPN